MPWQVDMDHLFQLFPEFQGNLQKSKNITKIYKAAVIFLEIISNQDDFQNTDRLKDRKYQGISTPLLWWKFVSEKLAILGDPEWQRGSRGFHKPGMKEKGAAYMLHM